MPVSLPNTTTTNNYPTPGSGGAQITARDVFASGWFTVANAAVFAQYSYGVHGQSDPSPDLYLAPGTYPLTGTAKNPVNGIRFKSAVPGSPAQIWGAFFYKDDPVLQSSAEFTAIVSATGGVTQPALILQAAVITGDRFIVVGDGEANLTPYTSNDPSGLGRLTGGNTSWTINQTGTYIIIPGIQAINLNVGTTQSITIRLNPSGVNTAIAFVTPSANIDTAGNTRRLAGFPVVVSLNANDVIEIHGNQPEVTAREIIGTIVVIKIA